jgi:hypothetical protein
VCVRAHTQTQIRGSRRAAAARSHAGMHVGHIDSYQRRGSPPRFLRRAPTDDRRRWNPPRNHHRSPRPGFRVQGLGNHRHRVFNVEPAVHAARAQGCDVDASYLWYSATVRPEYEYRHGLYLYVSLKPRSSTNLPFPGPLHLSQAPSLAAGPQTRNL